MSCWSFHACHLLGAWLTLRKGGGIAVAFVLVCLLSRCYVACGGHLLQTCTDVESLNECTDNDQMKLKYLKRCEIMYGS